MFSSLSLDETEVLQAIFWSNGSSRLQLCQTLKHSKSKTNQLVASLLDLELIEEIGTADSTGGRRAEVLKLADSLGVLVACDLGATSLAVAILKPNLELLACHHEAADVRLGPGVVLARLRSLIRDLLQQCQAKPDQVLAIGIGVPGPVNFQTAQLVNPPLMPHWDSLSFRDYLRQDYAAPVWIDNDVNVMALGELWRLKRSLQNFLVIKVGTGIGCGIICHGVVYRGATGSAGDVGHICVDADGPRCHCGNAGCVEAMAGGAAIAEQATQAARSGQSPALAQVMAQKGLVKPEDVGQAGRNGDVLANQIIQQAGNCIGLMLASVVNFFNPSHIFIGGGVTQIGPLFLASVRQSVYQRSLALSTRQLEIHYSALGEHAGVLGAGVLALQETFQFKGRLP